MAACDECGQWAQPSLAVDAVAIRGDEVLLIRRGKEPWKGMLAFPGGFVDKGEDPEVAVIRELKEECGIDGKVLHLLCVKGDPKRDPRGHVISIAYVVSADGVLHDYVITSIYQTRLVITSVDCTIRILSIRGESLVYVYRYR